MANDANPMHTDKVNEQATPTAPADPWLDTTKIGPTVNHPTTGDNVAVPPIELVGLRFPVRPGAIRYV